VSDKKFQAKKVDLLMIICGRSFCRIISFLKGKESVRKGKESVRSRRFIPHERAVSPQGDEGKRITTRSSPIGSTDNQWRMKPSIDCCDSF
jgi:hypothetical protein